MTNQPGARIKAFDWVLFWLGRSQSGIPPLAIASVWAIQAVLLGTTTSQAQQSSGSLPPPPTVSVPDLPKSQPFLTPTAPSSQDSLFQAPTHLQRARYLVVVNGNSPYLLQQVKIVAPNASIQQYQGRQIIQAGTFESEGSAQQRIAALNARGIGAELANGIAPPRLTQTRRYLVVIPGGRNALAALANQAAQLGIRQNAIRSKDAPLGPHLEIGPFSTHGEAEEINHYLRQNGMDSRVYFNR